MAPIVIPTRHQWWVSLEVWVLTTVEIMGFDDGGSVGWVWIGVRASMGLNWSSYSSDRDSAEALVMGFFRGVVGFFCIFIFLFFLGLKLLDCVLFLFSVKMKENKRRFWVLLLFVNCLVS